MSWLRRPRSRGQALAEFALVFPLLLILILAVIDGGRAVFELNALTNGAREGARLAIVNQDFPSIEARVIGQTYGTTPTVVVSYLHADGTPCGSPPAPAIDCQAVVTAQAPYQPITPIARQIIGQITLKADSEVAVEFVCPNLAIPEYATSAQCPKQP